MTGEKEIEKIKDSSIIINCNNCWGAKVIIGLDSYTASKYLYNIGWRASISGKLLCPDCIKKKEKSK